MFALMTYVTQLRDATLDAACCGDNLNLSTPRISAIVCTRNRQELLAKALKSLIKQTIHPSQYEILVIDNGSTDSTKEYVHALQASGYNIRYVFTPIPGIARARNEGLRSARGKYIAYIDDDATAEPCWLQAILECFSDSSLSPPPGIVCGPVEPAWEKRPPKWLLQSLWGSLSILQISNVPIFLSPRQWFPEGNSAYPKSILEKIGGFNIKLGRSGSNLAANEGTTVDKRIRQKGYSIYYHPAIKIHHFIPIERMTKKWITRREFWQGYSYAILKLEESKFGRPDLLHLIYQRVVRLTSVSGNAIRGILRHLFCVLRQSESDQEIPLLRARLDIAMELGYLWGLIARLSSDSSDQGKGIWVP